MPGCMNSRKPNKILFNLSRWHTYPAAVMLNWIKEITVPFLLPAFRVDLDYSMTQNCLVAVLLLGGGGAMIDSSFSWIAACSWVDQENCWPFLSNCYSGFTSPVKLEIFCESKQSLGSTAHLFYCVCVCVCMYMPYDRTDCAFAGSIYISYLDILYCR